MTCSADHSESPTLLCTRPKDHAGWHHDATYGYWLATMVTGRVGVLLPTEKMARRFNDAVSGYYPARGCVGVGGTADRTVELAGIDKWRLP